MAKECDGKKGKPKGSPKVALGRKLMMMKLKKG
jgi:hypothetical protein